MASSKKRVLAWSLLLLWVSGALLMTFFVWRKAPSHDRDWKTEHSRLPMAEFDGDRVLIRDVRNFGYDAAGRVVSPVYEDRPYNLDGLASAWYGISHFGKYGLAHTFLSFGFKDGRYLAISIEARQEIGESYSPVRGMLRHFELIHVVGEERDIIGLRTHIRRERVHLYPLTLSSGAIRTLLTDMLRIANEIGAKPRFYHTITDNCTVGIIRHAKNISALRRFFDYRVLLPGYSDRLAYDFGFIPRDMPLSELRNAVLIRPERFPVDDPAFSDRIRSR